MNTAEVHTIEHLGATFLRNHETYADKTIYFGPIYFMRYLSRRISVVKQRYIPVYTG